MKVRAAVAVLVTVVGGGFAAEAAADAVTIRGVGVERTITCDDREVVVYGTNHRLTLRGRCREVEVNGTAHVIRVEGLGHATIHGVKNTLEWEQALGGGEPQVEIDGLGNRAVKVAARAGAPQAAPAEREAAPATLVIDEGDLRRSYDCAGGTATVEGGENQLTLRRCRELTVNGAENRIVLVGPVRVIRLMGNDNTVEWSEGDGGQPPRIERVGSGNTVVRQPAP
jgi:hypothetical protein